MPVSRAPKLFAFLRAINVGGRYVTMEALRGHFEDLGLKEVESFITSGNLVFAAHSRNLAALELKMEKHLRQSLGYEVKVFIRTAPELVAIARYKPFPDAQLKSAAALNVALLAQPLDVEATKAVKALRSEIDDFHVHGREVYWLCKTRQGDSKFSNMLFEKTLRTRATFRSINTIARLAAKYVADSQ
jgi:uncharacterized protein (DUF1697 family)